MNRFAQRLLMIAAFFLHTGLAGADEAATPSAPQRSIPYKMEPTPVEEQGTRAALVLLLLLLVAGVGLYVVRRRVPGLVGLAADGGRMRIIERTRLNPRCTLYLVRLDHRELLIAQCGDNLVQFDPNQGVTPPAKASEANHA